MKATYCKFLSCLQKRDALTLTGEPRHVLLIEMSDRVYAFTSPRGLWTFRTIVIRKDVK